MRWNLADVFELVADTVPDRLALAHGDEGVERSWLAFDRRANALARHLAAHLEPGDKLALPPAVHPVREDPREPVVPWCHEVEQRGHVPLADRRIPKMVLQIQPAERGPAALIGPFPFCQCRSPK